jgi:hypothetical protein
MRARTWRQPYAELMFFDKIETRSKSTDYRGDVLICAGKEQYGYYELRGIAGSEQFDRIQKMFGSKLLYTAGWNIGKAVGVGTLVDCRKMEPADEERCFVKYSPLLYCWVFENVRRIEPMPFTGAQGWTDLTEEFIKRIKFI